MQNYRVSFFASENHFETKASLSNWQLTAYQIYAVQRLEKAIVWNGGNCEAKKELMDSDIRDEQYPKSRYKLYLFLKGFFFWSPPFLLTSILTDAITENARSAKKIELETYELCLGETSLNISVASEKLIKKGEQQS